MSNIVLIDVKTAGASGDMFLSALVSLIGEESSLLPVAASLLIHDTALRVRFIPKTEDDHTGMTLEITSDPSIRYDSNSLKEIVSSISNELELSEAAKKIAENALNELLEAESRAHETPIEKLQLHETGSIDTVLDIVGTAYLLEKAGLLDDTKFIATHVAVGTGTIQTEQGDLEVPVPAVAEILVAHDVPFIMGIAKTEVLTPTGAALLVTLADEYVESVEAF
ncbi:MAG: nickel insertion protein, partial [Candidatus Thorarchaeota archaeon]